MSLSDAPGAPPQPDGPAIGAPAQRTIVQGWIALQREPTLVEDVQLAVRRRNERSECSARGFAVSWRSSEARHAIEEYCLCVVWGHPRDEAAPGAVGQPIGALDIIRRVRGAGAAALSGIHGAFGVCFIDARSCTALLANDRFSMETLCWSVEEDRVCFADRADGVPLRSRSCADQSIYSFLYFHCVPAPETIFREVRRLAGGSHLEIVHDSVHEQIHWHPHFLDGDLGGLTGLRQQFRALVERAVVTEAAASEEVGCFLSGGTDSSTVLGMLCRTSGMPARAYSIGFAAAGYDEMEYARIAARHFGARHREYYITVEDIVRSAPAIAAFLDQPFGNSSVVPAYYCASIARADGVMRLLAGDGGDELFGGNTRYALQQFVDAYRHVPRQLRDKLIEPLLLQASGATKIPGLRQLRSYVRHATTPLPDRLESHNLLARIGAATILDPDWLAAVDPHAPQEMQRDRYRAAPAREVIDRLLFYDWKFTLADSDLPKVRCAVQLSGMSVGYPLLADEIVDFSLRLPARWKVRHGKLRWFFKKALDDFLPRPILRKKKHGFGLPFGVWANVHAPLRNLAADALQGLEARGILRKGFRDRLVRDLLPQHPGYYGELLWILMMLELWLASHAEATSSIPAEGPRLTQPA